MDNIMAGDPAPTNPADASALLSPADRDLVAALDAHALWMILHHDECEDEQCIGCINTPAAGGAR
jgi:hypothetical protein